jgi:hypothetical protein
LSPRRLVGAPLALSLPLGLALGLALSACVGAAWSTPPIGVAPGVRLETLEAPIRNGYAVPRTLFLTTQQMRAIGWINDGDNKICTGTIFAHDAVITARHCFLSEEIPLSGGTLSFAVPSDSDTTVAAHTFPFTPSDVFLNSALDVAIIRFPGDPFLNLEGVTPIPINTRPIEDDLYANLSGHLVSVAGYGETYENIARSLAFASVNVELITSRSIVVNGERRQGICQGDSGGPLLAPSSGGQPHIFAIESKGDPCCAGVDQLTRVDVLEQWIRSITSRAIAVSPTNWPDTCLGISQLGSCNGDLITCDVASGELRRATCPANAQCDYDSALGAFACMGGCGISPLGTCDLTRNVLRRCVRGEIEERSCESLSCTVIEDSGAFACVDQVAYTLPEGSEGMIPLCNPKDDELVAAASEARFVATSCATRQGPALPLAALAALAALKTLSARARRLTSRRRA